jgi:hypothetical protein
MDDRRLGELLEELTDVLEGSPGRWLLLHGGRRLLVVTDELENRMRIMTPVVPYEDLRPRDFRVLLGANFDRTLDARYATAGGYLWSLYMHPLAQLTEGQLGEGLRQVVALADEFGRSYASSHLTFTGGH